MLDLMPHATANNSRTRTPWQEDKRLVLLENAEQSENVLLGTLVLLDRHRQVEKGTPDGQREPVLIPDNDRPPEKLDGLRTEAGFALDRQLEIVALQSGFPRLQAQMFIRFFLDHSDIHLAPIRQKNMQDTLQEMHQFHSMEVEVAGFPAGETTISRGISEVARDLGAHTTKIIFAGTPSEPLEEKILRRFIGERLTYRNRNSTRTLRVSGFMPKEDGHNEVLLDMLKGVIEHAVILPEGFEHTPRECQTLVSEALELNRERLITATRGW